MVYHSITQMTLIVNIVRSDARIIADEIKCHNYTRLILKKKIYNFEKIATFVIGVATIVVEQNCDNCGWHCNNCGFLRQLWLKLQQLWLIATIVNIAAIVVKST